jgi:RNA polymerase sigma factor (sigma-70 family)
MDLEAMLRTIEGYAKQECKKRGLRMSDDLVQEALIAVWQQSKRGRTPHPCSIRRIIQHKLVDEIRQNTGRSVNQPKLLHLSLSDWQEVVAKSLVSPSDIPEEFDNLNPDDREIIRLVLRGNSGIEISRLTRLSKSAISRRMVRLRPFIREVLDA